jgi:hypothetical protein
MSAADSNLLSPDQAAIYCQVMALLGHPAPEPTGHPGGDLEAHLAATCALLTQWRAPPALCLAGLMHALYGTFGFEPALAPLPARPAIVALLGEAAEALVYFYCACDRPFCYPELARSDTPLWRDRFTGVVFHPEEETLTAFCELTLANELDVARHDRSYWHRYERLFASRRFAARISAAGLHALLEFRRSVAV